MANKTIIQLPPASTLYAEDVFAIQQLGVVTRHISASQLGIVQIDTIQSMTSAASSHAAYVSELYTDQQIAAIDLSSYATTVEAASMSANALAQANVYTQGASASIMSFIGALPPSGATLAQVAAASGNALVQANAYTDAEISGIDLSSYALVTSLQTTAGNLQAQINTKADSSALSSYALTTVAAAMSANSFAQSVAIVQSVSAGLDTRVDTLEEIVTKTGEPRGFENTTSSTMSFNDTTRTFVIAGSYNIWQAGVKIAKNGESQQIANTDGTHYLYYNAAGVFTYSMAAWSIATDVPIAAVYWDVTSQKGILMEERHGIIMDSMTHEYLHKTQGAKVISAGTLTGYATIPEATTTVAGQQFGIGASTIADEDLISTLSALADGSTYNMLSRSGSGSDWILTTGRNLPFAVGATPYIAANTFVGGTWAIRELTSNNTYVNNYILAVPAISAAYQYIIIPGQTIYSSLALAQSESFNSLDLSGLPLTELVAIYRLTHSYKTAGSTAATNRGTLEGISAIIANNIITSSSVTPSHNGLAGLQGGTTDEYYHLTAAQSLDFIGKTEVAAVSAGLVSYVGSVSGNLSTAIAGKIDSSVAASMSANSLVHANTFTTSSVQSASGNIMAVIGTLGGGVTLAQVAAASGNALVQANAITYSASANAFTQSKAFSVSTSANALVQSTAYTNAASASIMTYVTTHAGSGGGSFLPLTGGTVVGGMRVYGSLLPSPTLALSSNMNIGTENFEQFVSGNNNIAFGEKALKVMNNGSANIAIGFNALSNSAGSNQNVAIGYQAGLGNSSANKSGNVCIGGEARGGNGSGNVAIGYTALGNPYSYDYSVAIGYGAGQNLATSNRLVIHNVGSLTENISSESLIYGEFDTGKLYNKGNRIVTSIPLSGYEMLDRPAIVAPRERVMALGNVSGSFVIPLSAANYFTLTLTASGVGTFIAPPENLLAQTVTVMVNQAGQGSNAITWTNTKWAGGTAATLTSGGLDMLNFVTYDGGTSYIGVGSLKDIK